MVMAFVILMVPERVLNAPTHGTIQYHPSLLPRHRGPSAINWAIIQGDAKTGVAIFWPDDGPRHRPGADDQGGRDHAGRHAREPVLRQALSARGRGDGRERRPRPRGPGAQARAGRRRRHLRELVPPGRGRGRLVRAGRRRPQPHPRGRTRGRARGRRSTASEIEDPRLPSGSTTTPASAPGEVVAVDGDRLVVAAGGGAIAVRRRAGRRREAAAGEYARKAGRTAVEATAEGRLTRSARRVSPRAAGSSGR